MITHYSSNSTSGPRLRPAAAAIALVVIPAMLGAVPARAQQAEGSEGAKLEQVVVTANKRAQNLQDVPAAISVISDATLQRANVRDIDDLPSLSPALTISYGSQPGNNSINMRGIGTFSLGIGTESDVSVIVDDIPMGMQAGAFKDMTDIFRVEVLKGPQSTLFGKSSIAGVLNITTKPIAGTRKASTSFLLTDDREWRASATVSGPVSDTLRGRITVSKTGFGGVVDNIYDGSKLNGSRGETIMGKFEWNPTDQFQAVFSPHYNRTNRNCCVNPYTSMTPGGFYQNVPQLPATELNAGIPIGPGNTKVSNDYPAGGKFRDAGAGLRLNWQFGDDSALAGHNLTSITSFDNYHMDDYQDGDGTSADILRYLPVNGRPTGLSGGLYSYGTFDVKSVTQEVRLTSPDTGRFRYVAGFWYGRNMLGRVLVRAPASSYVTAYEAQAWNTNYALFGQSSFAITATTSVIAGLRANREDSGYGFTRFTPPPAALVPTEFYTDDHSDNAVTGKLELEHHLNRDAMAYAVYSTGYKGVAYDLTSGFNAAVARNQPVDPEKAKNFELGVKTTLLDNRATLDIALFNTNFRGFQQSAGFVDDDNIFRTTLHSIGGLRTRGLEVDGTLRVSRALLLNGSFAWTQATITEFENGPCYSVLNAAGTGAAVGGNCAPNPKYANANVQNLAGATLPNAPKIKLNLGGQFDLPLREAGFDLFFTGAYRWQSRTQFALNQDPVTVQGAYGIANVGFGLKDKRDRYKLSVFVNNLFDKTYAIGLGNSVATGTWSARAPNPVAVVSTTSWLPPRDYTRYVGARLDLNF
ncbi:TonB-dependent receptor [Massilia dura]|uniref:TonB-dependent receptor n=1 Tax=Pseudoduganella dura TaxID=321982 RepID=A0A6I3XIZ2_9BURK|nr:TonB-dependent receptor [Pseudoduganella dura]MUI16587.1 TonB-dependent receptor [Pseudoduganella dura]GGY02655.1 TonB-dependent receptor [Pseudoduganella dura]